MGFVIINGPNLNLLGKRNIEIYGSMTFAEFLDDLRKDFEGIPIGYFQTNHEGAIIDKLHEIGFSSDGIILNAGAYTHSSIAIRDAIEAITTPVIEVHISDIYTREEFRRKSMLADVCHTQIVGHGLEGYREAINLFLAEKEY
ncbi:MAG TPA: type II 3-dehydroquinate dehydratase [Saprospiraceae bacterium]|nr:type II 3-dehydroquinate dehydratase [Saprospiraceae bacterium]